MAENVPIEITPELIKKIEYSEKYQDDMYEYRHVILPKEIAKALTQTHKGKLLEESEWRRLGVQQSRGWKHYAIHRPEPHILLFRRELGTDPTTGLIDAEQKAKAVRDYQREFGLTSAAAGGR